jgi:putative phage-type endonuclease
MSIDIQQRSQEWYTARLGKVTASRLSDVVAKIKTGEAAGRAGYRAQLVAERLTGKPQESFQSQAMDWGTEAEPLARATYEARTGNLVDAVGFVTHPAIELAGASPDGFIGNDGLIEIKCPTTKTHIDTLVNQSVPSKYIPQMLWQMACTGRDWCDFVSFDPRMPINLQIFIHRVNRDDELISFYEKEVVKFLQEVDESIKKLSAL